MDTEALACNVAEILEDKLANDIVILDVEDLSGTPVILCSPVGEVNAK